jgi:hypothetical protein
VSTTVEPFRRSESAIRVAWACRTALLSVSCAIRYSDAAACSGTSVNSVAGSHWTSTDTPGVVSASDSIAAASPRSSSTRLWRPVIAARVWLYARSPSVRATSICDRAVPSAQRASSHGSASALLIESSAALSWNDIDASAVVTPS